MIPRSTGRRPARACRASIAASCLVALCACHAVGAHGEDDAPVGMLLEGSEGAPDVELAVRVRPFGLAERNVQPLAGAVHRALVRCGAGERAGELARALGQGVSLTFTAEASGFAAPAASGGASGCLQQTLAGTRLPEARGAQKIELELRASARPPEADLAGQRAQSH